MRRLSSLPLVLAAALVATVLPLAAISPDALAAKLNATDAPKIIDVRAAHDFEVAHIPGAMNIPFEVLGLRQLPPFGSLVVVADGHGVIDAAAAAAILRRNSGNTVDILDGGFAAWQSGPRPTTHRAGFSREVLPGITYQQLVAGNEAGMVLVDLRDPAEAKAQARIIGESGSLAASTTAAGDIIGALAQQLPGARVAADPFAERPVATTQSKSSGRADASTLAPAPMAAATAGGVPPLLVLIDNNDGRAQETARRLIASGNRRFVILSGGIDAVILRGEGLVERSGGTIAIQGGATP